MKTRIISAVVALIIVVPLIILASATILIGLCASPLLNLIASYM